MLSLVILNKNFKDQINILSFQVGSKLLNCFKNVLLENEKLVLWCSMNLALFDQLYWIDGGKKHSENPSNNDYGFDILYLLKSPIFYTS